MKYVQKKKKIDHISYFSHLRQRLVSRNPQTTPAAFEVTRLQKDSRIGPEQGRRHRHGVQLQLGAVSWSPFGRIAKMRLFHEAAVVLNLPAWQDVSHLPDLQRDGREHGPPEDVPQPALVQDRLQRRRAR